MTLLQINEAVEHGLTINPYNAGAYGALIVVILFVAWIFYQDKKAALKQVVEANKKVETLADKAIGVIVLVETKLPDPHEHEEIIRVLGEIKELVKK